MTSAGHVVDQGMWERRRYWHKGVLAAIEWWCGNRVSPHAPLDASEAVRERDFCYTHGTPIYPDLGCQVCGQLPARAGHTTPARRAHGR